MHYAINCVGFPETRVDDLIAMIDGAREISRRTFVSHVDHASLAELEAALGYGRLGLRMSQDYHVGYFSGRLGGRKVYFIRHSAIEYIFTPDGAPFPDEAHSET